MLNIIIVVTVVIPIIATYHPSSSSSSFYNYIVVQHNFNNSFIYIYRDVGNDKWAFTYTHNWIIIVVVFLILLVSITKFIPLNKYNERYCAIMYPKLLLSWYFFCILFFFKLEQQRMTIIATVILIITKDITPIQHKTYFWVTCYCIQEKFEGRKLQQISLFFCYHDHEW